MKAIQASIDKAKSKKGLRVEIAIGMFSFELVSFDPTAAEQTRLT